MSPECGHVCGLHRVDRVWSCYSSGSMSTNEKLGFFLFCDTLFCDDKICDRGYR